MPRSLARRLPGSRFSLTFLHTHSGSDMSLEVILNNSMYPTVVSIHISCYDDREAMHIHVPTVPLVIGVARIF